MNLTSKVCEGIVVTVIDKHSDTHNLSNPNQWGFKKGTNTETLLYLTETWKAALDSNRVVGPIFIDFRKAFKTLNHKILSYKLQAVGISEDLPAYCGKRSKLGFVKIGVPQGSNLGPSLLQFM